MVVSPQVKMNAEKLAKLQAQVRIGGKGSARRKKKVVHKAASTDDKKLQSTLKKINVNAIPGIDEVNMFHDNGEILHFINPKVQASLQANTFSISGVPQKKEISEMLPGIINQLGPEGLNSLRKLASSVARGSSMGSGDPKLSEDADDEDDEDVPDLVENFDEASKAEVV